MLGHVVAAARQLSPERLVVVVGHGRDQVSAHLARDRRRTALPVVQEQQHGTGHAVRIAMEALTRRRRGALDGTVVVTTATPRC